MTPDELDKILSGAAARVSADGDEQAAARAQAAILKDLRPVRPLASAWWFTLAFALLWGVAAAGTASVLGLAGWHALHPVEAMPIVEALFATALLAAFACARQMSPASGRSLVSISFLLPVTLLPLVFSLVFQNYDAAHLVQEGYPCLRAGLYVAVPTGIAIALLLRRGFVVDWSATGLAAGTLAGLAGLGMLELHCPNTKAIHVMIWHVAVVVSSGLLGFILGRARRR